jgi:hypothetical protein
MTTPASSSSDTSHPVKPVSHPAGASATTYTAGEVAAIAHSLTRRSKAVQKLITTASQIIDKANALVSCQSEPNEVRSTVRKLDVAAPGGMAKLQTLLTEAALTACGYRVISFDQHYVGAVREFENGGFLELRLDFAHGLGAGVMLRPSHLRPYDRDLMPVVQVRQIQHVPLNQAIMEF